MLNIGCHLSASKGFLDMGNNALKIKANTFQFFTRNPRGGKAKDIDPKDVSALLTLMKQNNFTVILAHAPYTLNPAAQKSEILDFANSTMADDLKRMEFVPGNMYNFHPGSHVGQGVDVGIQKIADLLNSVLTKKQTTTVLLETMSGKGTEIGSKFQELRSIIDKVELSDKLGVCLDTCHVYDAGYDIVNDLDGVIEEFDKIIGIKRLKAIHLNDSMNPFKSHKDRHQKIGQGSIGLDTFIKIINNRSLCHLPFFLETPNELEGYAEEIKILRDNYDPQI